MTVEMEGRERTRSKFGGRKNIIVYKNDIINTDVKLINPLPGFTRYDDRDARIIAEGPITLNNYSTAYKGTLTNFKDNIEVMFKFNGTAFKLICRTYHKRTLNATIEVDGVKYSGINMRTSGTDVMIVKFEMDDLIEKEHTVKMYVTHVAEGDFMLDVVDIKGELIIYNK